MNKKYINISSFLTIIGITLCSCDKKLALNNVIISHETKFGQIAFNISIDEFNNLGFEFGDSVDVSFSNGQSIKDIPYYSGYYVKQGRPLLIGYPGYESIRLARNSGNDPYIEFNLKESDKGTIKLNEKAKYLDIQNSLNLNYENDGRDFASPYIFGNFREITTGNIKNNLLYRSASPCDNTYLRASTVSLLAEENNIQYFLDLADSKEEIDTYYNANYEISYWKRAYENNDVLPLDLNMNFHSDVFTNGMKLMFNSFLENDGPFLIHCTEGKDRTGFAAVLFESLAGSSLEEIKKDYMVTYSNYYGINENNNKVAYDNIIDIYFYNLTNSILNEEIDENVNTESLYNGVVSYLESCNLTKEEINQIENKLKK